MDVNYLFHSGSNWAIATSLELDKLLDEAGSAIDEKRRLALYSQINTLIADRSLSSIVSDDRDLRGFKEAAADLTPNESFFSIE